VSFREITEPVISENIIHRVERVPDWAGVDAGPGWRALCGVHLGETRAGGAFEFEVAVALDPEAWRLAANCPACLAVAERRDLGELLP
jgi:hypothetical protein